MSISGILDWQNIWMTDFRYTHDQFQAGWDFADETLRQQVRDKAQWEHMTIWAVVNDWFTYEWDEMLRRLGKQTGGE